MYFISLYVSTVCLQGIMSWFSRFNLIIKVEKSVDAIVLRLAYT